MNDKKNSTEYDEAQGNVIIVIITTCERKIVWFKLCVCVCVFY